MFWPLFYILQPAARNPVRGRATGGGSERGAPSIGLAISDKNIIPRKMEKTEQRLFRRNSGIPFRTVPQRRKMLGILYHGTKIEANSRNFVRNHSAEEKTTRNSVPWNKNRSKLSEIVPEYV